MRGVRVEAAGPKLRNNLERRDADEARNTTLASSSELVSDSHKCGGPFHTESGRVVCCARLWGGLRSCLMFRGLRGNRAGFADHSMVLRKDKPRRGREGDHATEGDRFHDVISNRASD